MFKFGRCCFVKCAIKMAITLISTEIPWFEVLEAKKCCLVFEKEWIGPFLFTEVLGITDKVNKTTALSHHGLQ